MTIQADGIAMLTLCGERLTYVYAGHKANNRDPITVDMIVYNDKWFMLMNDKEVARGPIPYPIKKESPYLPFVHFSGIKGEVEKFEVRTLGAKAIAQN